MRPTAILVLGLLCLGLRCSAQDGGHDHPDHGHSAQDGIYDDDDSPPDESVPAHTDPSPIAATLEALIGGVVIVCVGCVCCVGLPTTPPYTCSVEGTWEGWYSEYGRRHAMTHTLVSVPFVRHGCVYFTGLGSDDLGRYALSGTVRRADGSTCFMKQYGEGGRRNDITYRGIMGGGGQLESFSGSWEMRRNDGSRASGAASAHRV
jgi:hypothetical protein